MSETFQAMLNNYNRPNRLRPDLLNGLVAFQRAAESPTFSAAAAQLGVTTAALSQTIKRLEERLAIRLFDRTTRSVRLTEAGHAYLARCRPALTEIVAATEDLVASGAAQSGLLRLSLPYLAGPFLIEPHLPAFFERYPNVRIELAFDDRLVNIVEDGFDAGIRIGELVERDMVAVPLTRDLRLVAVASPGYLARHGAPQTPRELARHTCITFRFPSSRRIYKWELAERGRVVEYDVGGSLIVNDGDTMCRAAVAGIGITYVIEDIAAPHLASGALAPVLEPYWLTFPGLYLYYPQRERLPVKLRLFLDFLRERLGAVRGSRAPLEPPKASARSRAPRVTRGG